MNAGIQVARSNAALGTRMAYHRVPLMAYASCSNPSYALYGNKRMFWGSAFRMNSTEHLSKEQNKAGSEGLHKNDIPTVPGQTTSQGASDRGDWVLFHPVYTSSELKAVKVLQHKPENMQDRAAALFVKALRKGFDIVSGYRHKPIPPGSNMTLEELRKGGYVLTESQWMIRILFLETIAGVPGFTAAMIRHLRGLRLMRRDGGWIHTLLEEAENERMHLMTFLYLKDPSIWFRALIAVSQGVFANGFFFGYLISPRMMHRFVGLLEEEATLTYTALIEDIEGGKFPEWEKLPAPPIAIDYWRLKPDASLLDVIYQVRSDETTHRFVNHTFANLERDDINPFALKEPDMHVKGVKAGFTRGEAAEYLKNSQVAAEQAQKEAEKV